MFFTTTKRLPTAEEHTLQIANANAQLALSNLKGLAFLNEKILNRLERPLNEKPVFFSVPKKYTGLLHMPKCDSTRNNPPNGERLFDPAETELYFQPVVLFTKAHGWKIEKLSLTFAAGDESGDAFFLSLTLTPAS